MRPTDSDAEGADNRYAPCPTSGELSVAPPKLSQVLNLHEDFGEECIRAGLSDAAFRTHVEGLLWAMYRKSDGLINTNHLHRFTETSDPQQSVAELVERGFWCVASEDRLQIEHGMGHQLTAAAAEERRRKTAVRRRRYRLKASGLSPDDAAEADDSPIPEPDDPDFISPLEEARRQAKLDASTALYRYFDTDDVLLYVGITSNQRERDRAHIRSSIWTRFAVRSTITHHRTRGAAEGAERKAIKDEQPVFNLRHNDSPEAVARLVEYLEKHGQDELLLIQAEPESA